MVKKLTGDYKIKFHPDGVGTEKEYIIDFTPPFKKIPMLKGLEAKLGIALPKNIDTAEARDFFDKLCVEHHVLCPAPRSTARLIDKVKKCVKMIINNLFLL